ncbi:MAG: histidine phosphatase family protein [Desulfopila sp.]|jgi:phosphohistidine phosphatase|nr:histidine phosphatase family protein [Desulfopila sp.]
MKKLYLIRHAKSSWSDLSVSDFERKLNKRGKRDGPFMARKLAESGAQPELILASPAARAKKTAEFMAKAVGYDHKEISFHEAIYHASAEDLLGILREIDDGFTRVFLVGHNYAITDLAEMLSGESLGNIPTTGIAALQCNVQRWTDAAPGCAALLMFDYPKKYKELQ